MIGILLSAKQLKNMTQDIINSPWGETEDPWLVLWQTIIFLLIDSFPLFLHFLSSLNLLFGTPRRSAAAAAVAKSLQSCPTLCDPIEGSPPGSPVPGILQARTLEWVAISFSNAWKWKVKVKSCLTLRDPMDCSPPGSFLHGIFQARVLEWGAIAFSTKKA